ncbi:GNAT family N-acetyltransferase [Acidisarcina polymorpha]|uniref:GNAT family N-acetyltransferase n=1 Tax=Acidisarcina polymorpha TaxID=2211140 RepID=UPI000DEFFCF7|nr:GNAT family N-acetyltransferase [Acidisarcina polymorpha]
MVRKCDQGDFERIWTVINDGARAYQGVIPADRWKEPYMPKEELQLQIDQGVVFWGYEESGTLLAVMGLQAVEDVTLIRHAYVCSASQKRGIGTLLLSRLRALTSIPVLIGTWASAVWAIHFYQKHGFELVSPAEKDRLLRRYWRIPERQIQTSVVLADQLWRENSQLEDRHQGQNDQSGNGG